MGGGFFASGCVRAQAGRRCNAKCSTIDIEWVVLVVAAAILGGWALFSAAVWRWLLLAAGLSCALAAMAVGINDWLAGLDVSVEAWIEAHTLRKWLADAKQLFGSIGRPVYAASVAFVCGALLSMRARSATPGFLVVGGVGVGVALERVFKAMIERTSTEVAELQGQRHLDYFQHSFPSGHVTVTAALLGMVAVCLGVGCDCATKVALAVPVIVFVMFVALLAVYATAHTFTDVIGGMTLGGIIVSLGAALLGATRDSRRESAAASL